MIEESDYQAIGSPNLDRCKVGILCVGTHATLNSPVQPCFRGDAIGYTHSFRLHEPAGTPVHATATLFQAPT